MEERRKKRRQEGRRHKHHGRKISPLPEKKKSAPLLAAFRLTFLFFFQSFPGGRSPAPKKTVPVYGRCCFVRRREANGAF